MHSNPVARRQYSAELKTKVLAACNEPGASIAAVALSHGLNANLVRKWLVGRGLKRTGIAAPVAVQTSAAATTPPTAAPLLAADARFLPIELAVPAPTTRAESVYQTDTTRAVSEPIHIELRRGALHLSVHWPSSAADDCTAWLRELSSGLLK
ncbi:MAG: transposase [Rubrivivax sp.]|nr:transposase [Rubrivivax sp.]